MDEIFDYSDRKCGMRTSCVFFQGYWTNFMIFDYEQFKVVVYQLTGIDLSAYKEAQMKRRIDSLIAKHGYKGYGDYVGALKTRHEIFEEFVSFLTINVSEFYRNPDQWSFLDREIIPELIRKFGPNLKIWSAACSTGDEPYSLVMALSRHLPLDRIHIVATDIDKQILAKAKTGLYAEKSLNALPVDFKKKYFIKTGLSYKISDEIKSRVEFRQQNLLTGAYPAGYHLIVCRNVLIYFTDEAMDDVYRKFYKSLVGGGILFIGNSEQIINYREIGYIRKKIFYYEKPSEQS